MTVRQTLRQFIVECILVSEKSELFGLKECNMFALVHERGGQQVELRSVRIGTQIDPKEVADLLEGTAEQFAAGVEGVQQFQVLAFFDGQNTPQRYYPLRKSGNHDSGGIMSEAPDAKGVLGQNMRLLESCFRISAHQQANLLDRYHRIIERQDERINSLEHEHHEVIELAKNLVMQTAADEHGRAVALLEMRQKQKDRETLYKLLPPVANRVLGKELFPQGMVDTNLFEFLADSLDANQIKKLAAILKPEQWGMIADRLGAILEKKAKDEEEEEKLKKKAEGKTEPEAAE